MAGLPTGEISMATIRDYAVLSNQVSLNDTAIRVVTFGGPDSGSPYINGNKTSGTTISMNDSRGRASLSSVGLGQLDSLSTSITGTTNFEVRRTGYVGNIDDGAATYAFDTSIVINGSTWNCGHYYYVQQYHGTNPASRYIFNYAPVNKGGGFYCGAATYTESGWFTNYWSGRNQCTVYGYFK